MFLGAIIFSILWCLIALFLRYYPETMAGYNTMPKVEREKIDIQKLGRFVSNAMLAGGFMTPSMAIPTEVSLQESLLKNWGQPGYVQDAD